MGMMAQPLPPIPQAGPPETEAPPLATAPQEPQQGNDVRDKAEALRKEIMRGHQAIKAAAANYPGASKGLKMIDDGVKEIVMSIMREIQTMPGSNPTPPAGPG